MQDLVEELKLDLEERDIELAEARRKIAGHERLQKAMADAPMGEIVGVEFQPSDVLDGRIVIRVAVDGDTRVGKDIVALVALGRPS